MQASRALHPGLRPLRNPLRFNRPGGWSIQRKAGLRVCTPVNGAQFYGKPGGEFQSNGNGAGSGPSDDTTGNNGTAERMAAHAFRRVQDAGSDQWYSGSGPSRTPGRGRWKPPILPSMRMEDILEQLAYKYFNWRKDTWDDLTLFMVFNIILMIVAGFVKLYIIDGSGADGKPFALAIYEILVVVFGQELPPDNARVVEQVFGIAAITTGLALFALVLALVEQVVLQVLEENVQRGSRVFETGHILILGWCDTQRDLEMVQKIVQQACAVYEDDGPNVIVVMTQREKLFMEAYFRRMLPMSERRGMQLVIRQGSPLVPADLSKVSASSASATIVVSDSARSPIESDAETIRAAVLLDEMVASGGAAGADAGTRHIVVQIQTINSLQTLHQVCSRRIMALHTGQINARRIVRMVKYPIVAATSFIIWSFMSRQQVLVHAFPELVGCKFGDLAGYFPDGTVYGMVLRRQKRCIINPPPDLVVGPDDELIMIRADVCPASQLQPLPTPVPVDYGGDWNPGKINAGDELQYNPMGEVEELGVRRSRNIALMHNQSYRENEALRALEGAGFRDQVAGLAGTVSAAMSSEGIQASHLYMLPAESHHQLSHDEPDLVLVCGWREEAFMGELLREMDHGPAALPPGSEVTLFNTSATEEVVKRVKFRNRLRNLTIRHVYGNPLDFDEVSQRLDVPRYTTAIVLCDNSWVDPDMDDSNGIEVREARDMLRLESQILLSQLHIRRCIEDAGFPEINIICEKVAAEGMTRFEDRYKLPVGISVNMTSWSAKMLTQAMYNPRNVLVFLSMGDETELEVTAAAKFVRPGEAITYWQLQARVQAVGCILWGYYYLPSCDVEPINFVINPEGMEARFKPRKWADKRALLITIAQKRSRLPRPTVVTADRTYDVPRDVVPWESMDADELEAY